MQEETERGDGDTRSGERRGLSRGSVIGRYVLLDRLGAGGMGVVVAAYDPELDRKLAIKVLHPDATDDWGRARLLQEAQALAKLSHPNVVAVHDVGTTGDTVWIAMELVLGPTLREWAQVRRRSWREVLSVMLPAGRGLAAAHAAGLVHRDFKPANVMIGSEGRVRVLDFGLARQTETPGSAVRQTSPRGTVAYMAAEQFEGRDIDARTDLFSYCVALWELLFGERPFVADSPILLARLVAEGRTRTPKSRRRVPAWLRRVLVRGLAAAQNQRWSSMDELLTALERGQSRARARWIALALVATAAVPGTIAIRSRLDTRDRVAACEEAGSEIAQVWNDGAREQLHALARGNTSAEATATKIASYLDEYVDSWRAVRTDACIAFDVRKEWSTDTFDRVSWCLDERRAHVQAVLTVLDEGDGSSMWWAAQGVFGAAPVSRCVDTGRLARLPVPPRERLDEIREARHTLMRAQMLQRAGRYAEALAVARAAVEHCDTLGWEPISAAAHYRLGEVLSDAGQPSEALQELEAAYFAAKKAGAEDVAASAALRLVYVVGYELGRRDEGLRWSDHAEVSILALGEPDGPFAATNWAMRSTMLRAMGDHAGAVALLERALANQEANLGPDSHAVGTTLTNLASAHAAAGELTVAKPLYERALRILESVVGREHPTYGKALSNLAKVMFELGLVDEAQIEQVRAIEILEAAVGRDHPLLASCVEGLAHVHLAKGEPARAVELFERVVTIQQRHGGANHPELVYPLIGLADAELGNRHPTAALAHAERALAISERSAPATLPEARFALARALAGTGAPTERVLAIAELARTAVIDGGNTKRAEAIAAWQADIRRRL